MLLCYSGLCVTLLCFAWGTVVVAGRGLQQADEVKKKDQQDDGFLSESLPLEIVATTPSNLATPGGTLTVQDQQALTVSETGSVQCMSISCQCANLTDYCKCSHEN